jgi:methionyl-tRNA formyltransferase
MGTHKRSTVRALSGLAAQDCEIVAVASQPPDPEAHDEQRVDLAAERLGLPLTDEAALHAEPPAGVDVVLSFLHPRLIREPLLSLGGAGCLNFHPAPLPDFRGLGGYNLAILEGLEEWGVSCHFVDARLDTGDLVDVERFPIDPDSATAFSLDLESQERLFGLFQRVMGMAIAGEELPRTAQGPGRYVDADEFARLRRVRPGDDLDRKLRAFWYPPHPGALLEVDGRDVTLVDEGLLAEVAQAYRDSGMVP